MPIFGSAELGRLAGTIAMELAAQRAQQARGVLETEAIRRAQTPYYPEVGEPGLREAISPIDILGPSAALAGLKTAKLWRTARTASNVPMTIAEYQTRLNDPLWVKHFANRAESKQIWREVMGRKYGLKWMKRHLNPPRTLGSPALDRTPGYTRLLQLAAEERRAKGLK